MSVGTRIRQLRQAKGWKIIELATRVDSDVGNISRLERGKQGYSDELLRRIAHELDVSVAELFRETDGDASVNVITAVGPVRSYDYPEISEVAAGSAMEAIDLLLPGEGVRHKSDAWAGPHGFWLRVRGDSMVRPVGEGVSFPDGILVLVAPQVMPVSGKFIVAKLGNDVTFKQYIEDAGAKFLRPLNPAYPTRQMDEQWQLVGTIVDAKWPKSVF